MTGGALPARAFPPSATAVMFAVLAGHRTYSDLVDHVGLSRSTIARHLHTLRAAGLVAWEDHRAGTLRPSAQIVPLEPYAHGSRHTSGGDPTVGDGSPPRPPADQTA